MIAYTLNTGNYTRVFHGPRCRVVLREHPGKFKAVMRAAALLAGKRPCHICDGQ